MPFYLRSEGIEDKSDHSALSKPKFGGYSHKGTQAVIHMEEAKNSSGYLEGPGRPILFGKIF